MVAEAPAIAFVLDAGDFFPGVAGICGAVDGEVDWGWFFGVVFPGCEEGAVGELGGAGVEDAGVGVGGWGGEDCDFGEGAGGGLGGGEWGHS